VSVAKTRPWGGPLLVGVLCWYSWIWVGFAEKKRTSSSARAQVFNVSPCPPHPPRLVLRRHESISAADVRVTQARLSKGARVALWSLHRRPYAWDKSCKTHTLLSWSVRTQCASSPCLESIHYWTVLPPEQKKRCDEGAQVQAEQGTLMRWRIDRCSDCIPHCKNIVLYIRIVHTYIQHVCMYGVFCFYPGGREHRLACDRWPNQ
jgi:hypothetical protein